MEELKLILDLLRQLGDFGKEAFIWWLLLDKGLPFLALLAFFWTVKKCWGVFVQHMESVRRLEILRDDMNIGTPGVLTQYEYDRMRAWVRARKGE